MNCIIIDDEPNAIGVLQNYIERIPDVQVMKTFRNPLKAIGFLQSSTNVDLIFLDINMPEVKGTDLLRTFEPKLSVIFTTAYSEYALTSYELNAVDYLVKPISFERFLKSINRARELHNMKSNASNQNELITNQPERNEAYVMLKSGSQVHRISIDQILYIEKESNYLSFITPQKKILVRANMNEIFSILPPNKFCQAHKSFVVALDKVDVIEIHRICVRGHWIPIGSSFRDSFLSKMQFPEM